jgi:glycosyltransferase involved in cell wall biosynthesis
LETVPSVTVATIAFNAVQHLEECVRSIQQQTFSDYEHVIVDDGSSDGTLELARALAADDPRIRVERNSRNLGIAGARNRCVSLARGEFLAWLDADDIAMPTRLERQYRVLHESDDVGIVGGYLEFFDETGTLSVRKYPTGDAEARRMIFKFVSVSEPAAMIRLSVLRQCGDYNPRYPPAADLDMLFRIAAVSQLANVPEVVIRYRRSATQATSTKLRVMEMRTLEIRWRNRRGPIQPTASDVLFNLGHALALYLLPQRLKLALVERIRNSPA